MVALSFRFMLSLSVMWTSFYTVTVMIASVCQIAGTGERLCSWSDWETVCRDWCCRCRSVLCISWIQCFVSLCCFFLSSAVEQFFTSFHCISIHTFFYCLLEFSIMSPRAASVIFFFLLMAYPSFLLLRFCILGHRVSKHWIKLIHTTLVYEQGQSL